MTTNELTLDTRALEAMSRVIEPRAWAGIDDNPQTLQSSAMVTDLLDDAARYVTAYIKALPVPAIQAVVSKQQLMELPVGTIVRSYVGTVACRASESLGVVFGQMWTFPWDSLELPAFVMPLPELPR